MEIKIEVNMQNGEQRIKAQVDAEMKFQTDSNLLNGGIIYSGDLTQEQINRLKANPVENRVNQKNADSGKVDCMNCYECLKDKFIKKWGLVGGKIKFDVKEELEKDLDELLGSLITKNNP